MTGDNLHAVGLRRGARSIAPCAELGADIIRAQAQKAWNCGLHAREMRAVAARTGGYVVGRITMRNEGLAPLEHALADSGNSRRWQRRPLCGEIFSDLFQIVFGKIGEQVIHRRVVALPGVESMKLVREIAGRLPG